MTTALLDLTTLVVNGQVASTYHVDILGAVTASGGGVRMVETIKGASTVTFTAKDPTRRLLTSTALSTRSRLVLDGAGFTLANVQKQGTNLLCTFEDMAVNDLRQKTGTLKAAKGTTTRPAFCTRLIREVPWIHVISAPGSTSQLELARGSADRGANKEDTWTAVTRIMGEIGWRALGRRGVVTLAPDSWLMSHAPAKYALSESTPGVDNIDMDYDTGKPAATATLTVWAGAAELAAGDPVTLSGMGAGNGTWLVETIERSTWTRKATVTCVRPQPVLPEQRDAVNAGNAGDGGWDKLLGGPGGGTGGGPGQSEIPTAAAAGKAERFVQYALAQNHKPYILGTHGPNTFDCSGLVQWCASRVGVNFPAPVGTQIHNADYLFPVDVAIATRGALLLRGPNEHVAISLGNGQTIEARGHAYGVGIFSATVGRGAWTTGGAIPGIPLNLARTHNL